MAKITPIVNVATKITLDVANGERLLFKVRNTAAAAAFVVRERTDADPVGMGRDVLNFTEAPGPDYETLWPWPKQKPAPAKGRHGITFAATFFTATKYTYKVSKLVNGSTTLLKDYVLERENNDDKDRVFFQFNVYVV